VASRPVFTVPPSATLETALGKLKEHQCGSLAVTSAHDLLGLFTERDVLLKTHLGHQSFQSVIEQPVSSMMTPFSSLTCATQETSLGECLNTMLMGSFRHMPVLDASARVEAMLSIRDICRALLDGGDLAATTATVGDALYYTDQKTPGGAQSTSTRSTSSITEVSPTSVVADAVLQMRRRRAGSVLVPLRERTIAEGCVKFGMFTERCYAQRALTCGSPDARMAPLADFITVPPELLLVSSELAAVELLARLTNDGLSHACVVSGSSPDAVQGPGTKLLGIISMRELLSHIFA